MTGRNVESLGLLISCLIKEENFFYLLFLLLVVRLRRILTRKERFVLVYLIKVTFSQ